MKGYLLLLAAGAMYLAACKKTTSPIEPTPVNIPDQTPPTLILNGRQYDTTFLQTQYFDQGATALDNKDGDISVFVMVSGNVNTSQVGNYTKDYNVRDAAGNVAVKVTRQIRVKNEADPVNGQYLVACRCTTFEPGGPPPQESNTNYTANAEASATANNSFTVNLKNGTGPNPVPHTLNINGGGINGAPFSSANGTILQSRASFTVNTTTFDPAFPARQINCTNVFTRQ